MVVIATDNPESHSHLSSEWPSDAFGGRAVLLNKKNNSESKKDEMRQIVLKSIHTGLDLNEPSIRNQFGHTKNNCDSQKVCAKCGGNHNYKNFNCAFEGNTYAGKLRYNKVDNIDYHVKSFVEKVVKEKLESIVNRVVDVFTNAIANVLESLNVDGNPILNNFNAALRDNLLNKSNKEIFKLSENYLNFPLSKNIDILCINESWLNANQKLKIQNYDIIRLDRINERGGGVCIIINKKINYKIVNLNPNEEIQLVKIFDQILCAGDFFIVNYYKSSRITESDPLLLSKIADLGDNVLLLGDLKTHSSMWSSRLTNKAGEQIVDFIFEKDFCLLNDESPTYQPMHNPDYKATLDLALVSSSLMSDFIALSVDDYIYSDHYPIIIKNLLIKEKGYVVKTIRTFNQEHFHKQAVLNCDKLIGFQISCEEEIDIYTEIVTKAINQAHEYATSFKEIRIREDSYFVLPKHIKKLINLKRRARDKFKKTRIRSDKNKFYRLTKQVKTEIKDHKFEKWSEFYDPSFDEVFKTEVINQCDSFFKYDSIEFEPSTVDEIKNILKSIRGKGAPGLDKITNKTLKMLPVFYLPIINKIINASLKYLYVPFSWKNSVISKIPKPMKDSKNIQNYRPISLLCTMSKVLEKIVLRRINKWLTKNKILNLFQSGFRSQRQTRDQILRILQNGIAAFNMNKKLGCTFIDIEKAFDKVWHLGLLYKLNSLKIPCYLGKWLANYLTNRTFMVRKANCLSNAQNIQTGVPQGSVFGPTLFNIYFNDIVNVLKDVDIALYADDLSFWVASTNVNYINLKLQQNLEKIYEWMCKWRLKVSSNKTGST
ncbi:unnamed protein product [Brachionus calyciflorus]|uniref:Reverse transcriptase domain-containing protein n=1 Tax=Brachionus calyciflorus TaxID=104777 RepID=A0A814FIX6_9BILA|nr:unnamed protein product [Brachionus calyciflorus]